MSLLYCQEVSTYMDYKSLLHWLLIIFIGICRVEYNVMDKIIYTPTSTLGEVELKDELSVFGLMRALSAHFFCLHALISKQAPFGS